MPPRRAGIDTASPGSAAAAALTWDLPVVRLGGPRLHRARRLLNVWVAAVGLVLCAPLLLVIAVAVRLSSPGPVLFTQTRIGLDRRRPGRASENSRRNTNLGGRPFTIFKFRTMYVNGGRKAPQVWAQPEDPRVTPLGRILRKYRLDELPQLVNVLRGEMNVVGPRPEQPEIFARLRREISGYAERQRVLPGITGRAQIRHHYGGSIDDVRAKLRYDLEYLRRQSVPEDLKIMLRTLPVMVLKRGGW